MWPRFFTLILPDIVETVLSLHTFNISYIVKFTDVMKQAFPAV